MTVEHKDVPNLNGLLYKTRRATVGETHCFVCGEEFYNPRKTSSQYVNVITDISGSEQGIETCPFDDSPCLWALSTVDLDIYEYLGLT